MAVLGVGFDLVSVPDFTEQLALPGTTMLSNFTPGERRYCSTRVDDKDRHLAARWAAKEAVFKAWSASRYGLPTVLSRDAYPMIEVVTDAVGRPSIKVTGELAEHLANAVIHVSLTHEGDMAGAFAVIEEE